jgi:uncharacterized DUF497 family protein
MTMKLTWDAKKANRNFRNHGVRFPDVEPIFEDERAIIIPERVNGEERLIIIGIDGLARILVVVCTVSGEKVRIISARKAGRNESQRYWG